MTASLEASDAKRTIFIFRDGFFNSVQTLWHVEYGDDPSAKNKTLSCHYGFYISNGSFPKNQKLASLRQFDFLRKFRREILKILH